MTDINRTSSNGSLQKLFKLYPRVQNWPCTRGHKFHVGLYSENFKYLLVLNHKAYRVLEIGI